VADGKRKVSSCDTSKFVWVSGGQLFLRKTTPQPAGLAWPAHYPHAACFHAAVHCHPLRSPAQSVYRLVFEANGAMTNRRERNGG
jgi:hypothetical protein